MCYLIMYYGAWYLRNRINKRCIIFDNFLINLILFIICKSKPMSDFTYDHILTFQGGFEQTIIDSSDSPHRDSPDFAEFVSQKVSELEFILSLQPGVNNISRYIEYEGVRYCINLTK